MQSIPLPEYERPPVVEVVYGITFRPLRLTIPDFGELRRLYQNEYPLYQEAPPLPAIVEQFEISPEGNFQAEMEVGNVPPLPRMWFLKKDGTALIQVQRDRFLHNWRKTGETDVYPRYVKIIEVFKQRVHELMKFAVEKNAGEVEPIQFEMTYVNHIPQSEGWNSLSDIEKVFPDLGWRGGARFLPVPEGSNWQTGFSLPGNSGRLRVNVQQALRMQDKRQLITMELTARGISEDRTAEGIWSWFAMAREWIVRGFTDLTGEEIQRKIWKRTR
jgi:uncharacterized protein (TIGR04255 family)